MFARKDFHYLINRVSCCFARPTEACCDVDHHVFVARPTELCCVFQGLLILSWCLLGVNKVCVGVWWCFILRIYIIDSLSVNYCFALLIVALGHDRQPKKNKKGGTVQSVGLPVFEGRAWSPSRGWDRALPSSTNDLVIGWDSSRKNDFVIVCFNCARTRARIPLFSQGCFRDF